MMRRYRFEDRLPVIEWCLKPYSRIHTVHHMARRPTLEYLVDEEPTRFRKYVRALHRLMAWLEAVVRARELRGEAGEEFIREGLKYAHDHVPVNQMIRYLKDDEVPIAWSHAEGWYEKW